MYGTTMHDVGDGDLVGFSFPCQKCYTLAARSVEFHCAETNVQHGHIILTGEDGTALVPACVFSRPFLEALLNYLLENNSFQVSEAEGILNHEKVACLSNTITPLESKIITENAFESVTRFCFHSF